MNNSIKSTYSLILLTLFYTIMLTGCTEETNPTSAITGDRYIHGTIVDTQTNERLDSVNVYWADDTEVSSTLSNTLGYYVVDNLRSENVEYELTFEKSGYATTDQNVALTDVTTIADQTVEEIQNVVRQDISMIPLNASISGIVYKEIDAETTKVAIGVTINANFTDNISPDQYSTITDATGKFTFTDLPASNNVVSIAALPHSDGTYSFGGSTQNVSLQPNSTITAENIELTIVGSSPIITLNNVENDNFNVTDNIVLTFSTTMDTTSMEITLTCEEVVPFNQSWDDDDITLTLDPLLPLQTDSNCTLTIAGNSKTNVDLVTTLSFDTEEGIALLQTNTESADGYTDMFAVNSQIELEFSKTPDVSYPETDFALAPNTTNIEYVLTGDTITIDPEDFLDFNTAYTITYTVCSSIQGDCLINQTITFTTKPDVN